MQSFAVYGNKPTMTAKNPNKDILMGQRSALSFYDVMAVNKEYCKGNCNNNCLNEGYMIQKNGRCQCVCPEGLRGSQCELVDSSEYKRIVMCSHYVFTFLPLKKIQRQKSFTNKPVVFYLCLQY